MIVITTYACFGREVSSKLIAASIAHSKAQAAASSAAAGGSGSQLALVPFTQAGGAGTASHTAAQLQDDMASLLRSLAAVFETKPALWYDGVGADGYQLVAGLMSHVSF